MTKIIVIHNGKGGVGKTTTVMGLGSVLAESAKILVVDTDIQGSCTWWANRGEMPFDIAQETNPELLGKLRQIPNYDLIIVDTPPALRSQTLMAVLDIADYIVLPSPCAPMDLTVLIQTVQEVVIPTKIPHRVLLTKIDPRCLTEAIEAQNQLLNLGIPTCHAFIRAYKAHEKAALDGNPITQARGKNAKEASADYRRVADELKRDW